MFSIKDITSNPTKAFKDVSGYSFWDNLLKHKKHDRGFGNKQDELTQELLQDARDLEVPELEKLIYNQQQYTGDFTPELLQGLKDVQFEGLGDSRLEGVNFDPRLMSEQDKVMQTLMEIGEKGGLRPEDIAALDKVQDSVAVQDKGRRDAIMQNMATRGMSGSGNELLAMLQSNQASSDRANDAGLQIAGDASQRALQSLIEGGNVARNLANDKVGLDMTKANAADRIAQFNATTKNRAEEMNTNVFNNMRMQNNQMQNDARQWNLTRQQDNINANNQIKNKELEYNQRDRVQQNFLNQLQKQQNKRDAANPAMNYYNNERVIDASKKQTWEKLIGPATKIGAAVLGGA